jgi:hypothetical protein
VLERAQQAYRSGAEELWVDLIPRVRAYAEYVVGEIDRSMRASC